MVDGDSCCNRRHGKGHFKGLCIPFGALVDFMPQNDIKIESFGSTTIQGIFLGYHIQPGGLWSGDYIVADYEPFKKDCDVLESRVKIHRIKEVLKNPSNTFTFLVAEMRRERGLRDQNFDAPGALPDAEENSDADDRPRGEETTDHDAELAEELSAKAGVSPGVDERGLGKETFLGRDAAFD